MSTVKRNFIYNIIYQILILIIPLITAPYLSRVVGVDGVGTYSYTYSIVYYFMLLTMLGVNNYGNRTIAKVKDNKKELSKSFWNIYIIQLLMGTLMITIYILYIFLFDNAYKTIAIIQALFIISAILDINWFYFGLEQFKVTITRNTIIKVSSIILILIFVKSVNDLWKYTLIMSGMTLFSQMILWSMIFKHITFVKINFKDTLIHLKRTVILFIPVIAVSIYKMMDKIMIGAISTVTEVGYYENAEKIINIPLTFISALGTVMLPRISTIISKGQMEKVNDYLLKSIKFVMFISFAMFFGLLCVGYNFAILFFGDAFEKAGILIMILSITIPFISFANVIRTEYLIPAEKDKVYIKSVVLGAILNFIMNVIFISKYKSIGACFGTIVAEVAVMIYQTASIKNKFSIKKWLLEIIPFLIKSFIMFLFVFPLNFLDINSFYRLIFQVALGIVIYGILNLNYILKMIQLKNIFKGGEKSA